MKLDAGWKRFGSVFEHQNGMRVTFPQVFCFPMGQIHVADTLKEWNDLQTCTKKCGGNRRRGLMLWAQQYYAEHSMD